MHLSPKRIIVDFLRTNLTDPRSRAEETNSDSFTATANQTTFTLTPTSGKKVACITSVTVNSVAQTKWEKYYIDSEKQRIIFYTGLSLNDDVVVNYKEGSTNWIYPDKPQKNLSATAFPRISVTIPTSVGNRLGNYDAPVEGIIRFQVSIWCKPNATNQIFTIDDYKYAGDDLAEYLAYQVTQAFENNVENLFPALYHYDPVGMPTDMAFNKELQSHHKIVEFVMRGIDLGRIS